MNRLFIKSTKGTVIFSEYIRTLAVVKNEKTASESYLRAHFDDEMHIIARGTMEALEIARRQLLVILSQEARNGAASGALITAEMKLPTSPSSEPKLWKIDRFES